MNRLMKESGVSWIGEMPNTWTVKPIKHFVYERIEKNSNLQTKTMLSLSAKNGVTRYADSDNHSGNKPREDLSNYKVVHIDDIVVNSMNILSGSIGMSKYNGCVSPVYYMYYAKPDISKDYVYFLFQCKEFQLSLRGLGNGILIKESENGTLNTIRMRIPSKKLLNQDFPLPSTLGEQLAISNLLYEKINCIDKLVTIQEQEIEKIKEYKQTLITEAVTKGLDKNINYENSGLDWINVIPSGWQTKRIKEMYSVSKGLSITKENLTDTGIKVISYGQIHAKYNESIVMSKKLYRFVNESYLENNSCCLVNKEDFIFADTSEDLAGTGDFVRIDKQDTIFAGYHSIILKSKYPETSHFCSYLFCSDIWRNQFRCRVGGVKLFSLTQKLLLSGSLILPPFDLQRRICDFLDKKCNTINNLIKIKQEKIEKLNEYKKSLIYEYVTGKKTVNS